jgi:hypothetical protein
VRRHQISGGQATASGARAQSHVPFDAAFAALLAAANDDFAYQLRPCIPHRRIRRIGKVVAYRPRPRRLDIRIVSRRPMMVVKRRPWGPPPVGLVCGREIIART